MYDIKQSTALDILVFVHDSSGDPVTGKVDGDFSKNISKNGGTFAAMTVTITERAAGWYHLQLSTAHTDTLGVLTIYLTATGIKQVNLQFRVHVRINDDLAYPVTSGRSLDVDTSGRVVLQAITHTGAVVPTVTDITNAVTVGAINANVITATSIDTAAITAAKFAAGAIDAAAIATDAIGAAEFSQAAADKVWVSATRALTNGSITNLTFAAGAIDAAAIATDAIGSAEFSQAAADKILATVVPGAFGAGTVGNIIGNRVDVTISSRASPADVDTQVDARLNTAVPVSPVADSVYERLKTLDDNYTIARAGNLDNLDAAITTRATPAQILATPANLLVTDGSGRVTVGTNADKTGYTLTSGEQDAIVDKVWDELISGHVVSGSFGEQLGVDVDAILVDTNSLNDVAISELAQAAPSATPTLRNATMLLYMALRNQLTSTGSLMTISNDSGVVISKATLTDDGTTFTRAELVAGP